MKTAEDPYPQVRGPWGLLLHGLFRGFRAGLCTGGNRREIEARLQAGYVLAPGREGHANLAPTPHHPSSPPSSATKHPYSFGVFASQFLSFGAGRVPRQGLHDGGFQREVVAGVAGVGTADRPVRDQRPRQALGHDDWVVSERREDLLEDLRLPAERGHPLDLGLELLASNRTPPEPCEGVRLQQVVLDSGAECALRQHLIERRLRAGIVGGPDPVPPVDGFDGCLCGDALLELQRARSGARQSADRDNNTDNRRYS